MSYRLSLAKVFYGGPYGYDLHVETHKDFPMSLETLEDLDLELINRIVTKLTGGFPPVNPRKVHYDSITIPELNNKTFPARIGYSANGVTITWLKQ